MKEKRYFVAFNDLERRTLVYCLNEIRNRLKQEGRYTDAVDELILRICDAPTKRAIIQFQIL